MPKFNFWKEVIFPNFLSSKISWSCWRKSTTDAFKTASKREIPKIVEATSDFIGNETVYRLKSESEGKPREAIKERFVPSEKRQKTIDKFRLSIA